MRLNADEIVLVSLAYVKTLKKLSISNDSPTAVGLIDTVYLVGQIRKNRCLGLRDVNSIATDAFQLVRDDADHEMRNRELDMLARRELH